MHKKKSLRVRLCILVGILVVITEAVAIAISERGFYELDKNGKDALINQSVTSALAYSTGKTAAIEARMRGIISRLNVAARYVEDLYVNPDDYVQEEVPAVTSLSKEEVEGKTILSYTPFEAARADDPKLKEEVVILSPIEQYFRAFKANNSSLSVISIYTDTGISMGYDSDKARKLDLYEFNPEKLGKDYYIVPKETGDTYITDVYEDAFGRGKMITVSSPFMVDGSFRGVVAADICIEALYKEVVDSAEQSVEGEMKLIIDKKGDVIGFSGMDKESNRNFINQLMSDMNDRDIIDLFLEGYGFFEVTVGSKDYLVVFDDADLCRWTFLDILPYDSITAPSIEFDNTIRVANTRLVVISLILFFVFFVVAVEVCKRMLRPLSELTKAVSNIDENNIEFVSGIKSGDEIEILGNKFEMAFKKAKEYMENLAMAEAERHRIGVELSVATEIQSSSLPGVFPPYPDRKEFDIYAYMHPAKEVGGDFYDFFFIDDDHLCLVIADVSGKGVGAAMFMMISKTFLNGQAHVDMSPAAILTEVNDRLCENNTAEMFVTVWLAILDVRTGKITASNGGHEYPFIQRAGGSYEIVKDKHSLALGAYPGVKFSEYEIQLNEGDAIFVYTDGVAEATNANDELFGTDRTLEALNKDPEADVNQTVENVRDGIRDFILEAPQFDDITMLTLRYHGNK